MAKERVEAPPINETSALKQAWISIAVWMTLGLLLEGLLAFRSPAYLQDEVRREMFRLAHSHGGVLNLLLLAAAFYIRIYSPKFPKAAMLALRLGVVLMPVGFLLGGVWHSDSDPGPGVFLAPLGGLMIIFGVVSVAVSAFSKE
ncbi:MAG: hypothetical protein IPM50_13715 [Acidobacteriota bacterium]|nr:MAG: hypothetical protein IPM50_13715 [Acidobacteriota bacterium]